MTPAAKPAGRADSPVMTQPAVHRYVVRKPAGDPDAARWLAAAYDELADDLDAQVRRVTAILAQLHGTWTGRGARASSDPVAQIRADTAHVTRALRSCAADLRTYAARLARAHEHHGFSLGRLVALGAIVTIGAAAVVVTMGAAAPAEAAAAAAAVEGAEAAATAAEAAGAGAAETLSGWQSAMAVARPLLPFLRPHLVSAAASVGFEATSELVTAHRLSFEPLLVAAAAGFAGSTTSDVVEARLATMPSVVRRVAEAGTWAATGATSEYAKTGHVDPSAAVASATTGFVARDVRNVTGKVHDVIRRSR